MTMTALLERESGPRPPAPGTPTRRWRGASIAGILTTPALLILACGALLLYLSRQHLDDIEVRSINREVISQRLFEHIELVAVSTVAVIVFAVPLGVLLTRPRLRRLSGPILALANIGQAVPSIGVLVLLAVTVGIGFQKRSSRCCCIRCCRSCATPWSAWTGWTAPSSTPDGAWA